MKNYLSVFAIILVLLVIFPAYILCQKEQTVPSTLVITKVTIVDVEKGVLEKNRTVTVSGRKIQ